MPIAATINTHWHLDHATSSDTYRIAFENLLKCAAENAGAVCAEGWLGDAAGMDVGDKEYARAAVEYYVDQIIRSESKRAEFCAQ